MIVFCAIFFAILIFPIYINTNCFINKESKKIFFKIDAFKIIKIVGGYISFYKQGLAIHISEKKALLIPFKNFIGIKEKVKPLKDYHFIKFNSLIEIGTYDNLIFPIVFSNIYAWHNNLLGRILYNKKPYIDYRNDVNIIENENSLNVYVKLVTILNLLMILISLIKIITEKILNAINRKKQNKFSN